MLSPNLEKTLREAYQLATNNKHEYVTLEHLLLCLLEDQDALSVLKACAVDTNSLKVVIENFIYKDLENLKDNVLVEPDVTDRASSEMGRSLELRTGDRARKLIGKIDAALKRIDLGTYGYCMDTDEPISLKRLEARPIATLSLEAQERHERMEKTYSKSD